MDKINNPLQPLILDARARYRALAPRERVILLVGGVVVLITSIYLGIIEPVINAHRSRIDALASSRAIATQLESAAALVAGSTPQSGAAQAARGMSLLAAVDQSTRSGTLGKAPERMQPEGENEVKVWFEGVPFDTLARWIAELQTGYGINVDSLDIEAQPTPGVVNARLSLKRGH